jgi:hypothetical protein
MLKVLVENAVEIILGLLSLVKMKREFDFDLERKDNMMIEFFNYIDNIKITFTSGLAVATLALWAIFFLTVFEKSYNWIKSRK